MKVQAAVGQTLHFEWDLDTGDRGVRIYLARPATLDSPLWTTPQGTGQPIVTAPHYTEDLSLTPKWAGTIYFRLCVFHTGQPDDQCDFTETHEINVKAGPQCSDGIDNDGDGKTDLKDRSCLGQSNGKSESAPVPDCYDGKDNDGDRKTDFPRDPGCKSRGDQSEVNRTHKPRKPHHRGRHHPSRTHHYSLSMARARQFARRIAADVAKGVDGVDSSGVITCLRFSSSRVGCRVFYEFTDGIRCSQNVLIERRKGRVREVSLTRSEIDTTCDPPAKTVAKALWRSRA